MGIYDSMNILSMQVVDLKVPNVFIALHFLISLRRDRDSKTERIELD